MQITNNHLERERVNKESKQAVSNNNTVIKIITFLYKSYNYGGVLQAFALWRFLTLSGYQCQQIAFKRKAMLSFNEKSENKSTTMTLNDKLALRAKAFDEFRERIPQTIPYSDQDIHECVDKDDIFIAGSDQIWNPNWCKDAYCLNFVPEHNGKIAYSASIGKIAVSNEFLERISSFINRFDYVSVRETSAKKLLSPYVAKDIKVVSDPTLLLTREEWGKTAVTVPITEPYIFVYLLGENPKHRRMIKAFAKQTGLKIVSIPHMMFRYCRADENFGDYELYDVGPAEFLGLINGAEAVVTDSFHGCVFSIIFEKSFCALKRHKDTDPNSMNSRLYTLFSSLGIENERIVDDNEGIDPKVLFKHLDYADINKRLGSLREDSANFLLSAIEKTKKRMTDAEPFQAKSFCTGCTACYSACPVNAISMKKDEEGFAYPFIDPDKCINCSLCKTVCNQQGLKKIENLRAYAAIANDDHIRENSSSGGVFTLLAENIIRKGGVVFGAAFDENFEVKHISVEDVNELSRLRGSKYVQSALGDTFKEAKKYLNDGREVLFTGTPCQIAGLKTFLKKSYQNLTTADLVCHGVPSPKVWKKYVEMMSQKHNAPIERISFRAKNLSWKRYAMLFSYKNNIAYLRDLKEDPYLQDFLKELYLRPSCYNCRFKSDNREADITLGDFWGIEKVLPEIDDDKGTSLVITNTPKGCSLLSEIKNDARFTEVDASLLSKYNSSLVRSVKSHPHRAYFFFEMNSGKIGIEGLLYKYMYMQFPQLDAHNKSDLSFNYSIVSSARIDVKNNGTDENDVDVISISDASANVEAPNWMRQNGMGRVIRTNTGKLSLKLKCTGSGKLTISLKGQDIRDSENKRIPAWVNYTKLTVDGKVMFDSFKPAWHDAPQNFSMEVKDGQLVDVQVEYVPDYVTIGKGSLNLNKELASMLKRTINPAKVSNARLDVQVFGLPSNDVEIIDISDPSAKVEAPVWMRKNGSGRMIKSNAGTLSFKIKCKGNGKLSINLRGEDVRDSNNKRIPIWVYYTKFSKDGKIIFSQEKPAWHDAPQAYSMEVKDGQVVAVHVEWVPNCVCLGPGLTKVTREYDRIRTLANEQIMRIEELNKELAKANLKLKEQSKLIAHHEDNTKKLQIKLNKSQSNLKKELSANTNLKNEVSNIRSGMSFRIGRVITYIPRKILKRD